MPFIWNVTRNILQRNCMQESIRIWYILPSPKRVSKEIGAVTADDLSLVTITCTRAK